MKVKVNQSDFNVERARAERCFANGQIDKALIHYKNCISLDPYYIDGHFFVGMLTFRTGEIEKAESYLGRHLRLNNDHIDVYFHLCCLFEKEEDFKTMLEWFKEAVFCQTHENIYYQMGLIAEAAHHSEYAKALYQEALRVQPDLKDVVIALSALLTEESDYQTAEAVLNLSLKKYPDDIALFFALGLAYKAQRKFESAIAQFNTVVSLQPEHVNSLFHLADCCVHVGFFKQAEALYQKVHQIDQSRLDVCYHEGQLYEEMKDIKSAVQKYRQWIEFIEDQIWHQDRNMQKQFKACCRYVADYYQKNGDHIESSYFRRRAEVVEMDEMGGIYAVSASRDRFKLNDES